MESKQRSREEITHQVGPLLGQRISLEFDDERGPADVELRALVALQTEVLLDIRDLLAEPRR